jgi:phage/plasmid primase-like uncharacterized protein
MTSAADTAPKVNKIQSNYKTSVADLKAKANGQWPSIFSYCGMPSESFSGKPNEHVDCPFPNHGGAKDFRFDNKNRDGSYICSCSSGADGFNAIATFHGIENKDAIKMVAEYFEQNNTPIQPIYTPANEKPQDPNHEKPLAKKRAGYHADKILSQCELKNHPYLQEKGIDKLVLVIKRNYTVNDKQTIYAGALIVPIYDIDNQEVIIGVQFINPNGQRFYIKDTKIEDGIHTIEGDSNQPYVDIVEGMATGISANMATGATTIVVFDANGVKGKAERIKQLFSGKKLRFLGDNDSNKRWAGNEAAHTAALKTGGLVAIPPISGKDWDDQRKANGIEATQTEINTQLTEYNKSIEINEKITGLSITSSILLSTENKAVSFDDALINHSGKHCVCPISGNKAIINAGFIYSFTQKRTLIPILFNLYDKSLIDECSAIKSTKGRLKWVASHNTQKHLYAFISLIHYRLGADLPGHELFNEWLAKEAGVGVSSEIMNLIKCLQESRINQAKKLIELEPKEFSKRIKLRQEKQKDGSLMLNWEPALKESQGGKYKLVAIKAQHGQGKTQSFIKNMLEHANSLSGGVVIAHRRKLIAQISKELNCCNYEDYDKRYYSGVSLTALKGIAVCINSFKHEHFLSYLKQSHSVFIDEASQVLKNLHTNKQLDESLLENIVESAKNVRCIYLTDADLTSKDIRHYQQLFDINDDEILVITAEPPERHYFAKISCSSAPRHYRTKVIQSIIKDLQCNTPSVLAVESETQGKSIFKYLSAQFPDKNIKLLTSNTPESELKPFIENITEKTENIDLLIHTSLMGTGISVKHKSKRFKKGYGLFSGSVLTATECLQMMRRFRDIEEWGIGLLCRPESMIMTSFYNNLGAKALNKHGIETSNILSEIKLDDIRNKAIFIHAFVGLLRDEYKFNITGQLASDETIKGMMTNEDVREEEKQKLIKATPQRIDKAMLARKRNYRDYAERYSSEAAICIDYFKCNRVTEEEAEIWCNPSAKDATDRLEKIIKILRLDSSIHKVEKANEILNKSGITLNLFKRQRLNQEEMKALTNSIASHCAELVGFGLLRERYSKESKIPKERPIKFVTEFLKFIGLNVETIRTRANDLHDREYQLDISVPKPMVSRLGINARTDKEILESTLREQALKLLGEGLSYGGIAKELGIEKWKVQRILKP